METAGQIIGQLLSGCLVALVSHLFAWIDWREEQRHSRGMARIRRRIGELLPQGVVPDFGNSEASAVLEGPANEAALFVVRFEAFVDRAVVLMCFIVLGALTILAGVLLLNQTAGHYYELAIRAMHNTLHIVGFILFFVLVRKRKV